MRGNERGYISIPAPQQNCRASIIILRQTKSAIFLRHLDSKRADLRESLEIFRRNFARAIDLVRIDVVAQIRFEFAQEMDKFDRNRNVRRKGCWRNCRGPQADRALLLPARALRAGLSPSLMCR